MLFSKNIYIILFSIVCVVHLLPMIDIDENNYGPYIMTLDQYEHCKGPKATNLTFMCGEMDKERQLTVTHLNLLVDAKIESINIRVSNIKDNKKTFLWTYRLTDPCKHIVFGPYIKHYLNTSNCLIKKGKYVSTTYYDEMMRNFLGPSFFYGTREFKTELLTKKGNIACFIHVLTFHKKA